MQSLKLAVLAAGALFAVNAYAAPACEAQATDKKLSGAARTSFVNKCVKDTCEAAATEKKLAGAAKTSNVDKCIRDATPAAAPAAAKK